MAEAARLDGKVAIVTGAGRGIGQAIAVALAENGAKVVVNDVGAALSGEGHDEGPAQETVRDIERRCGQGSAIASTASVAEWQSAQDMIKTAVDRYGRLDIVVNNAGILRDRIFHQMTPEEFDAVVKVHLYGSFYISRAAATLFRSQQSGAYVHLTSTSGLIGSIGQANYAAAKMGIAGLSRSIAMDMARYKVRSNCIAPHAFSRMIESVPGRSPEEQERVMEQRRRMTRPDQIAQVAAFLASEAAAEVSGQIFGVRGNEIYLYSQPRAIRTLHRSTGWTPSSIAETLVPSWRSSFTPLERSATVYSWEPI